MKNIWKNYKKTILLVLGLITGAIVGVVAGEKAKYLANVINKTYNPDGLNILNNCKEAAGQSVMHIHVHLIPRYNGDVENPRGGIRGIIPKKQNY